MNRNLAASKRVNTKAVVQNLLLLFVSTLIFYLPMEAGYRYYLFLRYKSLITSTLVQLGARENRMSQFDPHYGFSYTPNKAWQNTAYQKNIWHTNQYGMIANDIDQSKYPVKKPPGEYRIALLGDSFTASNPNYIRWADLLQDYLNRSPQWRAFVGGKFTRVLNFGLDGTGITQWALVYKFKAKPFSPDLVIVNYITDDVMRAFIQRGQYHFKSDAELRNFVERKATEILLREVDWYVAYPELLADTIGKYFGMKRRLGLPPTIGSPRFETQAKGIARSIRSLQTIRCLNPNSIVVNNPQIEELEIPIDTAVRYPSTPQLVGLQTKFLRAAEKSGIKIINLAKIFPVPSKRRQLQALYNLPLDGHMSDYGNAMYASWLFRYLLQWSATNPAELPAHSNSCN